MGNIIVTILNIMVTVVAFIFKVIGSVASVLFAGLSGVFNQRAARNHVKSLHDIHRLLSDTEKRNNDLLLKAKSTFASLPSGADRENISRLIRYCGQVNDTLAEPINNIRQDLSKVGEAGFVFRKDKYANIINFIHALNYPLTESQLQALGGRYSGWNYFIETMLHFSKVDNLKPESDGWTYRKNGINFRLQLNEVTKKINIRARSESPISYTSGGKTIKRTGVMGEALLSFDANRDLTVNLMRNVDEMDHYDVSEFFDYVERLLHKSEINPYIHKSQLSYLNAEDLEDNVSDIIGDMKKTAPPPVDYLPDSEKMHGGKQRWAQLHDLKAAGMLNGKGFIIGKMGYGSYIYTGNYSSHILTIASVGSGKGVGVVIPNLLRHKGSAVILDPKGENFLITANRRHKLGNKVFYYDPWDVIDDYGKVNHGNVAPNAVKARINPFDFIDENDVDAIDIAKMLASSLIIRGSSDDAFFYNGAETFLARLIVYICTRYKKGDPKRNMAELRRLLIIDSVDLIKEIYAYCCATPNAHPIVKDELFNWLDSNIRGKSKSMQSIYAFAQQGTDFLSSSRVKDSLISSNMDILSIKTDPTSLYLVLDMDKLLFNSDNYKPLVRLIITTCMLGASRKESANEKLLFMLDEIAQLGPLQYLPNLLSIIRYKGVVVWTIWQNISQIQANYPNEWQSIIGNCDVQQYFGVNDAETAKIVSEKAGQTTIYEESVNTSTTYNQSTTNTESRGDSYSNGTTNTKGENSGYSYQGFNYTNSGGSNTSVSTTNSYTDSYNFSKSIQIGFSETSGKTLAKKAVPLLTPFEVTTGNAYSVQFVFYMSKCPYPILSGKIKYYEDMEFYGEYDKNLTTKNH